MPNRDRALVALDRRRSDGDFPPHHFLWFSAAALEATLRRAGFARALVLPVPEPDAQAYASFLESSLVGGATKRLKRAVRGALGRGANLARAAEPAPGSAAGDSGADVAAGAASASSAASRLLAAGRAAKNLPFLPLALALRRLAPTRTRALYFEAS